MDDGKPVRQTDLQLHFHGSNVTYGKDHTQAFLVRGDQSQGLNPYAAQSVQRSLDRHVEYSGRFPQSFSTSQNMKQWEPQLTRTLTLSPSIQNIPQLAWDDISLITSGEGRTRLRSMLSANANGKRIDAVVLHQEDMFPVFPIDGFLFSHALLQHGRSWQQYNSNYGMQYGYGYDYSQQMPTQTAMASIGLLEASSRVNSRDFFSIVSQVAPQGSAAMEDLPLLDSTDPDSWLLMVAVEDGSNITVFRRLFHASEAGELSSASSTDDLR